MILVKVYLLILHAHTAIHNFFLYVKNLRYQKNNKNRKI